MNKGLILVALLLPWLACSSSKPVERPQKPPTAADYLVDSNRVGDLQRGAVSELAGEHLGELSEQHGERWIACGADAGAVASYHSAGDPALKLTATVVEFEDPVGAFCGYTPGRGEQARAVPELEGAFEEQGIYRAWRANHVVEVRTEQSEALRELARGLLRAMAAQLPGDVPPVIPDSSLLPENSLVVGSERIVPTAVLPSIERPALVADVRCSKGTARALVVRFDSPEAATKALETYHGVALEDFKEVSPYQRDDATGIKVKGEDATHVLFTTGPHILGLIDVDKLKVCDEPLAEVTARAAPLGKE